MNNNYKNEIMKLTTAYSRDSLKSVQQTLVGYNVKKNIKNVKKKYQSFCCHDSQILAIKIMCQILPGCEDVLSWNKREKQLT